MVTLTLSNRPNFVDIKAHIGGLFNGFTLLVISTLNSFQEKP